MFKIGGLMNRRSFIRAAAVSALAPAIAGTTARAEARSAANDRVAVGVIGLGGRGMDLLRQFLREPSCQVVAVCDVAGIHYRDQPWEIGPACGREAARRQAEKYYANEKSGTPGQGIKVLADFRELCALAEVDAVVVATPDHWHARCTLAALEQGKDVYCEKPVTHFLREGQVVREEVARRKAVFQAGSHQRSMPGFRRAVEIVLNGHLGKIQRVEVGLPPGYEKPQGDATITEPPGDLDYDFWCGPAPKLPYCRARHHRWWRGHRAFGGGVLMDWIGHYNDIAHWALGLDASGPQRVEAVDWVFPEGDVYNTPWQYEIRCEYAGGVTTTISSRHAGGTKFIGENGWLLVERTWTEQVVLAASTPRWLEAAFAPGPVRAYSSDRHTQNFLECCTSRQACAAPIDTAHRSITPGHLGYVAQALGRAISWDPELEVIRGDDEAQRLLMNVDYRAPWRLTG